MRAELYEPELASQWTQDKVHEFLEYFGVKDAESVPVFKLKNSTDKFKVRRGIISGISINEDLLMDSSSSITEDDLLAIFAVAAATYTLLPDVAKCFLKYTTSLALPVATANIFLAWLNRQACARDCSLCRKLCIGLATNVAAVMCSKTIFAYYANEKIGPCFMHIFQEAIAKAVDMFIEYKYFNAAEACVKLLKPSKNDQEKFPCCC
ncbi:MAG TPA: hypothetical protein PKD74_04800 [Candidatus Dependentiae bacterium]|nr:hypothetical protein [Candidatus Dependentiae bacterium]